MTLPEESDPPTIGQTLALWDEQAVLASLGRSIRRDVLAKTQNAASAKRQRQHLDFR
jgi:hypothetical protein